MSRTVRLSVVIAIVAGGLLGLLAARTERASAVPYSYYVYVHPGATSTLNCGWHSTCLDPWPWGTGLDWANQAGAYVYYRSYSNNNGGLSWSARALITDWNETCRKTYVSQYRRSGAHDSTVRFVHTGSNFHNQQFYVSSGYYPTWTSREVGNTMNESGLGCATTGPHLHEETWDGHNYWINTQIDPATGLPYFPEATTCHNGCGTKPIFSVYQLGFYWQE